MNFSTTFRTHASTSPLSPSVGFGEVRPGTSARLVMAVPLFEGSKKNREEPHTNPAAAVGERFSAPLTPSEPSDASGH